MPQPKKPKPARPAQPQPVGKAKSAKSTKARRATATNGPVTLEQAQALVSSRAPMRAKRRPSGIAPSVSPKILGEERKKLEQARRRENQQRIREYKATMEIMKERGVKGLAPKATQVAKPSRRRAPSASAPASAPGLAAQPLQIFAEGDSWFDYPKPLFGGGIIPRLQKKLGVPILNLAKAGDEVRYMLGVEQRKSLAKQLTAGCPAGGPWDVLLFSGGGNDIVDNQMALWIRDFTPSTPAKNLIHQARYDSALDLVRAAYEDLISMRDALSPTTHLVFHAYDFAIPDGRGVCWLGPWLKPTLDLRKFPVGSSIRFEVVKEMLVQFANLILSLASTQGVTFINGQGTLKAIPGSWDNELHPSKDGFEKFASLFKAKLRDLFPHRVP